MLYFTVLNNNYCVTTFQADSDSDDLYISGNTSHFGSILEAIQSKNLKFIGQILKRKKVNLLGR